MEKNKTGPHCEKCQQPAAEFIGGGGGATRSQWVGEMQPSCEVLGSARSLGWQCSPAHLLLLLQHVMKVNTREGGGVIGVSQVGRSAVLMQSLKVAACTDSTP